MGASVGDLARAMQSFAPLEDAESWDRVGLQVGSRSQSIDGPVLLTIDLTEKVLEEALSVRASVILAYHPPIWEPIDRLTDATPKQKLLLRAIRAGLAIYTPHTALDAAPGGIADWLCEGLSASGVVGKVAGDCRALEPASRRDANREMKIVTFVPTSHVEAVRNALASGGAGIIGKYRVCSFAIDGTGTFLGGEGSRPAVGEAGKLEQVAEVRLEMVCSRAALPLALATLRHFHPYEEPAIDVYALEGEARRGVGPGRRLVLDRPATVRELAERLRGHLDRVRLRMALVGDDWPVTTLGVVPGAGASLMKSAMAQKCEVFITGEMKHHEVMECIGSGMGVLLAGHTNTERGYLVRLAERLRGLMPGTEFRQSVADRDVITSL